MEVCIITDCYQCSTPTKCLDCKAGYTMSDDLTACTKYINTNNTNNINNANNINDTTNKNNAFLVI